jgi:hypothetical protein
MKVIGANILLLAFAYLPIHLAYGIASGTLGFEFAFRGIFILCAIVFSSTGISFPLALTAVPIIRGREYQTTVLAMLAFFGTMVALIKLIFPAELSALYAAAPDQFVTMYGQLPLNYGFLPTYHLSVLMTSGFMTQNVFLLLISTLFAVGSCLIFAGRMLPAMITVRSAGLHESVSVHATQNMYRFNDTLMYKDLLSVIRTRSETGYALFIMSIAVFLFTFLRFGSANVIRYGERVLGLNLFLYAWILFFTVCIYLRYLFPLVAREGRNASLLFSLPVSRFQYLTSKMRVGAYLSFVVSLFSIILLVFMPFTLPYRNLMIGIIMLLQLLLSQLHVLLGSIVPNFHDGDNAEKVSTSGMGLFTLIVSIAMTVLGGYVIYFAVTSAQTEPWGYIGAFMCFGGGLLGLTFMRAIGAVRAYQP